MLDIKFIRQNPEKVKEGCRKKGVEVDIEMLLQIDKEKREFLKNIEKIRAEKNRAGREISRIKEKKELILRSRRLDQEEEKLNKKLRELEKIFEELMLKIPNLPFDEVPLGRDEKDNVVLREVGERPKFDFQPKSYLEIAKSLDLIDIERSAKTSGTRFAFLKREAVFLEFAIIQFAFDTLTKEGFIPIIPPVLIREEPFRGMGYLERGRDEVYYLPKDNLYLIGTAEQIIGPMHMGEIFSEKELPKRYLGFSSCFRREAGSYGRDAKGIFRVHQFEKIEMFSFCKPEDSKKEHLFFLSLEEKLMQLLKIPYLVVEICTGELGDPAAAKYDIEAWIPSENRYRETHSASNCTDFQARRLNIRYREKSGKLSFVHTINGTAFAIGRTLIAIIENYQQKEGFIKVPEVLQKYLPFREIKR